MDKRLKIGLVLMALAVLLVPIAIVLKNVNESLTLWVLIFTMLLELSGLLFVIASIIKKRKS